MFQSLRARLFLLFGSLVALLIGAEWYLARALTQELREESGQMALSLGNNVFRLFDSEFRPRQRARVVVATTDPRASLDHVEQELENEFVIHRRVIEITAHGTPEPGADSAETIVDIRAPQMAHELSLVKLALIRGTEFEMGSSPGSTGEFEFKGEWNASTEGGPVSLIEGLPVDGDLALQVVFHQSYVDPDGEDGEPGERTLFPPGMALTGGMAFADGGNLSHTATEGLEMLTSRGTFQRQIPIPVNQINESIESFHSQLLLGSLVLLLLGLSVAGWLAHRVTAPMRSLASAALAVGEGKLGTQVPPSSDPEVAPMIAAFNRMSGQLAELQDEATVLREREHLGELGEVARGLAHTLRNPLNVLGLTIEELAREQNAAGTTRDSVARAREDLRLKARREVCRIDETLKSFLSLASSGGQLERVPLGRVARDVALELSQAGGTVRVQTAGDKIEIEGVSAEIRAVVHTLVVNAVEASPEKCPVDILVEATEGGARFVIEDRGSGLDPQVRERLFTPHVTTKASGAGMGLYLAHRIVTNRYQGQLQLAQREGGGTRATLELGNRSEESDVHR